MQDNRMDVTKHINATITEEGIQFIYNHEVIGIIFWADIPIEMHNDYILTERKIYQKTKRVLYVDQYVDGCGLSWC
jgi:hypothetical protein